MDKLRFYDCEQSCVQHVVIGISGVLLEVIYCMLSGLFKIAMHFLGLINIKSLCF